MQTKTDFVIEFSGWITIDAPEVKFVNSETGMIISGDEYLLLDEEGQGNHYLESLSDCLQGANDGAYEQIDIETRNA